MPLGTTVAIGLSRLGARSGYFTKISRDVFGERILAHLARENVGTDLIGVGYSPAGKRMVRRGSGRTKTEVFSVAALVLLLGQDQGRLGDGADVAWAEGDALEGAPAGFE